MARNPKNADTAKAAVVTTLYVRTAFPTTVNGQSNTPRAGIAVFHIRFTPFG